MRIGTIDLNKLRGVADKAVGLGKEALGTLLSNDRLAEAGEAQQDRAREQLKALRRRPRPRPSSRPRPSWPSSASGPAQRAKAS